MKKITLLLALLLIGITQGYAQCIMPYLSMTVASENSGTAQAISGCNYSGNYNQVTGLIIGETYLFKATTPDSVDKYITITDFSNNVLAYGISPLTVEAISSSEIRTHISDDNSCTTSFGCIATSIQLMLNCPLPTGVSIAEITSTMAGLTWYAGSEETAWEVLILSNEAAAPSSTTSGILVDATPAYMDDTLTAGTAYRFYVRAVCESSLSPWKGPFNFTTACNGIALMNENFDTTSYGMLPACWSQVKTGPGSSPSSSVQVVTYGGNSDTSSVNMYNANTSGEAANLFLASAPLSNLSAQTHRLKFFAKSDYGTQSVEIGTLDNVGQNGTFSPIVAETLTTVYQEFTVDFTSYGVPDMYIAFRHNGASNTSIHLDDIRWEVAPSCPDVADLSISSLDASSASLYWTPGNDEAEWEVVYGGLTVTDPATLTPITPNPVNSPEALLAGLSDNTDYRFWVRSVCGTDKGVWIGPKTFKTACLAVTGLNENFDALPTDTLPECWSQVKYVAGNFYARTTDWNYHSASRAVIMYNGVATTGKIALATPELVDLPAGTHRLKFFAASSDAVGTLEIGTSNLNTGDGTFTLFQDYSLTQAYQEITVDFTQYEGTDTYIIFRHASPIFNSVYLDDIRWEMAPLCTDVSAISVPVEGITPSSAIVQWMAGAAETAWKVVYGDATVTDPSLLTPIPQNPTTTQATLEGLSDNTDYNVWVRSVCGANEGAWIGPVAFSTTCLPASTIDQNFETFKVGSLAKCWHEVKGVSSVSSYAAITDSDTHSGFRAVKLYKNDSDPANNLMLVSPELNNLAAGTHQLKFYVRSSGAPGNIQIGTIDNADAEGTFTMLDSYDITYQYTEITVDFSQYEGTDTHIAFRHNSQAYNSIYLDDIKWEQNLSIDKFDGPGIQYYPNPVKEVLTIINAQTITSVGIFNMLGQKVQEVAVNANNAKIDMGGLSAGSYIARVVADGQIKTIKVIKE